MTIRRETSGITYLDGGYYLIDGTRFQMPETSLRLLKSRAVLPSKFT